MVIINYFVMLFYYLMMVIYNFMMVLHNHMMVINNWLVNFKILLLVITAVMIIQKLLLFVLFDHF